MYFQPPRHPFRPLPTARRTPTVAVVGGGPVGLTTALGLAHRGCEIVVFEAEDSACFGSRAICVSRHSLEVLDPLGVAAQLMKEAVAWTSGRSFYRGIEVLRFQMPHAADDVFPPMVNVSQSRIEQLLVDAAHATDGLTVQWSSTVVGCEQAGDHVGLDVDTPDGRMRVLADWLVAADGARSTVRDLLGLRMSGASYEGRYVIADIHWPSAQPTERRVWFDAPSAPGSTLILHQQPDDIWRVDYQLGPDEDPEVESAEERIRARIGRHLEWLGDTTPWTLEWSTVYRAHALSLERYRHGRVLFVGDAAHLVPIFGVRGLNSGLEDADALAWTLPLVVRGRLADAALDVWAAERRGAWEQNIAQADLSTRFMTPGTDGYRLTRDAVLALAAERPELSALVNPRQSSATHARGSALTAGAPEDGSGPGPGDPVADVPLASPERIEGSARSLLGLAGGRFAVVSSGIREDATEVAAGLAAQVGADQTRARSST